MRGYHPLEILGAKISTCGIMTAITVTLLTFIYFCQFSVPLTGKVVLQLLLIFLIMLHLVLCGGLLHYDYEKRDMGRYSGIYSFCPAGRSCEFRTLDLPGKSSENLQPVHCA